MSLSARSRAIVLTFWILAAAAFPIWNRVDPAGYDVAIYHNAIVALKAGQDPYLVAIAAQDAFHRTLALHANAYPPYSYVYSPITLPLLRVAGDLPTWFSATIYTVLFIAAVLSVLWVTTRAREASELTFVALIAPLAIFCPGLLAHDTILSGNIAFILYALVLLTATYGWRRGVWRWCYLAILIASCFKAPMLSLVAIPFFSARRQWLPASLTAALGLALFGVQPLIWPALFRHFLQAVQLQFTYNNDFGSSPAGVFSNILVHHGLPYSPASLIAYLLYAAAVFAALFYLSRQYLRGHFPLTQWMPVLLVGVILLNPRIMEYDAAPLAIPMALIGWRFFTHFAFTRSGPAPRTVLTYFAFFLTVNILAVHFYTTWKPIECFLLVSFFTAGCWDLLKQSQAYVASHRTAIAESANATSPALVPVNS